MNSQHNLAEWPQGQAARVLQITGDRAFQRRLMSLGVAQGTSLEVVRSAPLGDPLHVKAGSLQLAIRRQEARNIVVARAADA